MLDFIWTTRLLQIYYKFTIFQKWGGKIASLNDLTVSIWKFCMDRNLWLSANHIAGVENIEADIFNAP